MPNPKLNRRYQRLIDQLDRVDTTTREMFLYLFAMVAAGQGIITVVRVLDDKGHRVVVMNDPSKKREFKVSYPESLEPDFADAAIAEMERLLSDDSLSSSMDITLFRKLYESQSCQRCHYHQDLYWQICTECRFAGRPVNFEQNGRQ